MKQILGLLQIPQISHKPHLRSLGLPSLPPLLALILPLHSLQLFVSRLLRLLQHHVHTRKDLLCCFRQWKLYRLDVIGRYPRGGFVQPCRDGGFAHTRDKERGEHVACAAEEAVEGGYGDGEESCGTVGGAVGGADDRESRRGGREGHRGDEDVGNLVRGVEFGNGGGEGGRRGYGVVGEFSCMK